jgi:hypothetical protein
LQRKYKTLLQNQNLIFAYTGGAIFLTFVVGSIIQVGKGVVNDQ